MLEKMPTIRSAMPLKPLLSKQRRRYIPVVQSALLRHNERDCEHCVSILQHHYRLNPDAKEFIPRWADIENTPPPWPAASWLDGPHWIASHGGSSPNVTCKPLATPAQRPAQHLPGGPQRATNLSATTGSRSCSGPAAGSQQGGQSVGVPAGVAVSDGKPAKDAVTVKRGAAVSPEAGSAAGSSSGAASPANCRPIAAVAECSGIPSPSRHSTAAVNQTRSGTAALCGVPEGAAPLTHRCDGFIAPPTDASAAEVCRKINSVHVSTNAKNVVDGLNKAQPGAEPSHNTAKAAKHNRSPSQCSDSTKPRRSTSRDSRAENRASSTHCAVPVSNTAPAAQLAASTTQLDTCSGGDRAVPGPSVDSAAVCRLPGGLRPSPSVSFSGESDDGSSDASTLSDEEWDSSTATFLPGSSVDSADDFICFVSEDADADVCCAAAEDSWPPAAAIPRTPVFGPALDQADSGLSAETDPSESDSEVSEDGDFSEDESDGSFDAELWRRLSMSPMSLSFQQESKSVVAQAAAAADPCDACLRAPVGTCLLHQRIAEANRQLRQQGTPPQHRTPRVKFVSGDRLATVHVAPDYDRAIASELLDQQRQRDRQHRWRQEVEREVAPVLAAVLTSEHRQRVLRQRPELLCS